MNRTAWWICVGSLTATAVTGAWLSADNLQAGFLGCLLFYGILSATAAARLTMSRNGLRPARVQTRRY